MSKLTIFIIIILLLYIIINRANILGAIAQFKYTTGKFESGFKLYKIANKIGKLNFNHSVYYAYISLKEGYIDEANKLFNLIGMGKLTTYQKAKLKESHALVAWKRGELEDAIEMLEYVHSHCPSTTTYGSLGYMYIHSGNLEKSLEYNLEGYDYNNENAIIVDNLAFTYLKLKDYENAEKYYKELFKLEPTFPEGYYEYGKYLIEVKGLKEEGIEFVKKALDCRYSFLSTITRRDILNYLEQCGEDISKLI